MIIFPSSSALIFTHFLFSIFYEGLNVFSIFFVFFSAGLEVTDCIPITVVICACLNFVEKLHNQIHITCPAKSGARQTSGLGFSEPGTNSGPPHPPSQGCLRWRSPDKVHVINYYFSESIINYVYRRVYQYLWHPPLPSGMAFIPAEVRFPAALSGRVSEKRIFSLCFFPKIHFPSPWKEIWLGAQVSADKRSRTELRSPSAVVSGSFGCSRDVFSLSAKLRISGCLFFFMATSLL